MKRPWLYAVVAATELVLLGLYFARTGVAMTPSLAWDSFSWTTYHGAFEPARFIAVWSMTICACVIAGAWFMLACGTGAAILAALDWQAETPHQQGLIAAGLGLGLLSLVLFALAVCGLVRPPIILVLGLGLLAFNSWRWTGVRLPRLSWSWPTDPESEPLVLAAVLAAVLLLFHLLGALVPPTSFDEMDYQLSLPKLYALNHGFVSTPYSHFSFFPRNINLLFMLGLVSGGPITAKLFGWALSLFSALALYAFTAPRLGKRAAGFAAAVYFFTPVIGNQFRIAAPDLGTGFFELVGLFLLLDWRSKRSLTTLALSGVFWGLALGSKYTALPDFAVTLAAAAWLLRKGNPRATTSALGFLCVTAGLLWSPWLIKNWWESGNPFNPVFSTIFTSRNFFFAGQYKATVDYSVGLGIPNYFPFNNWRDIVLLPWHLIASHNDFNHDTGPVWLLLLPLSALSLGRRRDPWLGAILLVCGLSWFWWLCLSIRITRYFAAGLALSSLCAGWILDGVPERGRWRWALLLPVFLAWFQQAARMVVIQNDYKKPWGYLAGRCSLGEYLAAVQPDCPFEAFDYVNESTPKDARVLVFNEFRTFYLDRDFLASTPWDHDYWLEMVRQSRTPDELLAQLKARGITYFVANENFRLHQTGLGRAEDWSTADLAKEKLFLPKVMRRVYRSGENVWVAKIRDRAS
jgi:hypothetical protein